MINDTLKNRNANNYFYFEILYFQCIHNTQKNKRSHYFIDFQKDT